MKKILQLEELALTLASIYLIIQLPVTLSWWLYILLFFAPDIGMLGYIINNKIGAITYNLFHHRGISIATATIGVLTAESYIVLAGLLLLAHASFDRIFGYGLKHYSGFKHTHLGEL